MVQWNVGNVIELILFDVVKKTIKLSIKNAGFQHFLPFQNCFQKTLSSLKSQ